MSDRIPGSSWSNPIWYKLDWRIYVSDSGIAPNGYAWAHDDYDGAEDANDIRAGHGSSVEDCKAQINAWLEEHGQSPAPCPQCNDTGLVALSTRTMSYRGPGPVPDDARGVCESYCDCPIGRGVSFQDKARLWWKREG